MIFSSWIQPSTRLFSSGIGTSTSVCTRRLFYGSHCLRANMRYGFASITLIILLLTRGLYGIVMPLLTLTGSSSFSRYSGISWNHEDLVSVVTAVPNEQVGKDIAQEVVNKKYAACVNMVGGVESVYWWQGQVENEKEVMLIMKTRKELVEKINQVLNEKHPYEVPELVVHPLLGGSEKFLKWIIDSTENGM